jgi:hypothetical protein
LRFLDNATESIELNYTIEKYTSSSSAAIRVNNLGASSVMMYYGNSAVSTTGSASDVYFNPISAYYFDDNANDFVGSNDGTVTGANLSSGYINRSYDFDGNDDYITLSNEENFRFNANTDDFSFACWIYLKGGSANPRFIIDKRDAGTDGWSSSIGTDNKLFFRLNTATIVATTAMSDNTWNHIAVSVDRSGSATLYTNGLSDGSVSVSGITMSTTTAPKIGTRSFDTPIDHLEGNMDEMYIYDSALTVDEVYKLYTQTAPQFIEGSEQNTEGVSTTLISPENNQNILNNTVTFNFTSTPSLINLTNATLHIWMSNGTLLSTNFTTLSGNESINTTFINTLEDGMYKWNAETCGEGVSCSFASSNNSFIVHVTPITIDISEPNGTIEYIETGKNQTLSWELTEAGENLSEHVINCSYTYNSTINYLPLNTCVGTNTTNFIYILGVNTLTFNATDKFNLTSTETINWDYEVAEINQTYSSVTFETAEEEFIIWVELNGTSWNSVDAKLNYNGTNYSSISGGSGTTNSFTANIQIPSIETSGENLTFYWVISLSNSTDSLSIITNSKNQSVSEVLLSICGVGETPYVRFNTVDAENPFPALNATFKSAWDIGSTASENQLLNFSYEDVTETNNTWEFCLSPNTTNYTISVDVEADASNFSKNFYYISDADYTAGETSNITLYLLEDDLSTPTTLLVRDNYQKAISDALIFVQFYDTGTDTFYTVTMGKSNQNGEDIVYLNWYDSLYKFVIVQNNSVTFTTDPYKIGDTPQIFQIEEEIVYDFDKFRDFEYSLFFNNATNNFVLTYVKPSALVESGCLRVVKREATADTEICETCSTSASATLYCNIANAGNGTFIGTFYATGSLSVIEWITTEVGIGISETIFNLLDKDDAAFYTILMTTLVLLLFLVSPVFGIIGLIAGLLLSSSLGFSMISYGAFLFISCVGGVVIWILKR